MGDFYLLIFHSFISFQLLQHRKFFVSIYLGVSIETNEFAACRDKCMWFCLIFSTVDSPVAKSFHRGNRCWFISTSQSLLVWCFIQKIRTDILKRSNESKTNIVCRASLCVLLCLFLSLPPSSI